MEMFAPGWFYNRVYEWQRGQVSAANSEAFNNMDAKAVLAQNLVNATALAHGWAHTNSLTAYQYLNNSIPLNGIRAEVAAWELYAAQKEASDPLIYDSDYVLTNSYVVNGSLEYIWAITQNYNTIFDPNLASQFVGTYDGMGWGMFGKDVWNNYVTGASDASSNSVRLCRYALATPYNDHFVVDGSSVLYYCHYASGANIPANITFYSKDGVALQTFELEQTTKLVQPLQLDFESQEVYFRYNVESYGVNNDILFGDAIGYPITGSPQIVPIAITSHYDGEDVYADGIYSDPDYGPYFRVYTSMIDSFVETNINGYFADMNAALTKSRSVLTAANNMAQSYYNMLVATNADPDDPAPIRPDVVFLDPNQAENLTYEQLMAIYMAYMNAAKDWFQNYTTLSPSDVNITIQGLNMFVRGAIYDGEGIQLYDNTTIYTPFNSLDDWTFSLGNNTAEHPGYVIIWGSLADGEELTADFTTASASMEYFTPGYNLSAEQIFYEGEAVDSVVLEITDVDWAIGPQNVLPTGPQGLTDLAFLLEHWYWFAVIAGIIFVGAWIPTRSTAVGVIGLILLAAGGVAWVWSDAGSSGGLLSGLLSGLGWRL